MAFVRRGRRHKTFRSRSETVEGSARSVLSRFCFYLYHHARLRSASFVAVRLADGPRRAARRDAFG